MMNIISWIVFGFFAGVIAKMLMPGKDPGGWFVTILLGIGGSFIGGKLGQVLGIGGEDSGLLMNMITAVIGALLLLTVYRYLNKNKQL